MKKFMLFAATTFALVSSVAYGSLPTIEDIENGLTEIEQEIKDFFHEEGLTCIECDKNQGEILVSCKNCPVPQRGCPCQNPKDKNSDAPEAA